MIILRIVYFGAASVVFGVLVWMRLGRIVWMVDLPGVQCQESFAHFRITLLYYRLMGLFNAKALLIFAEGKNIFKPIRITVIFRKISNYYFTITKQ